MHQRLTMQCNDVYIDMSYLLLCIPHLKLYWEEKIKKVSLYSPHLFNVIYMRYNASTFYTSKLNNSI